MHLTISRQIITFHQTEAKAAELAASLLADDPETDYRHSGPHPLNTGRL